jgi:hypothetical protein
MEPERGVHQFHWPAKLDEVIKMVASDTRAKIEEIERRLEVRLPNDYSRFLLTRGSMNERISPANCSLQIYPVDDVIPINEAGEIQDRFPGALVIGGDGSREMLAYDFRQSESSLVLLDITAEDWSDAVYQASSLTALLAQLPERGWFFD